MTITKQTSMSKSATTHPSDVPKEVLSQSVKQRLEYFGAKVIKHPRLVEADQALMDAICHPGDATLVFVFGPTGVGKSTLRRKVEERLLEMLLPELQTDVERIPYASVEAKSPERGYFNWKMYYRQALLATMEVGESMPERKRRLSNPPAAGNPTTQVMQAVQQKVFFSKKDRKSVV